jgi:hypothetical protein
MTTTPMARLRAAARISMHRTTTVFSGALSLLIALALGSPALAANCGGGTACACGDTVTASRTLSKGADPVLKTVCPGPGLIVSTDGVVLKLGDGTMRGSGGNTGILVQANGVTIQGPGTVQTFGTGIAGATSNSTIDRVRLTKHAGDGLTLTGDQNVVFDNHVVRNGGHGIRVEGDDNTVEANRAAQNGLEGILVIGDGNQVIGKNTGAKNKGTGIKVVGDGNSVVQNHQTHHNRGHGIRVVGAGNCIGENATTRNKLLDILASLNEADPDSDGNNIDGGRNNFNQVDELNPQVSKNCKIDGQVCDFNAPACP